MPQDLPGFYYDAEKNRYFPIKGPIPGSNRSSSSSATSSKPESKPSQPNNIIRRTRFKTAKLLQDREVYGNVIISGEGKCNFQEEYRKRQASQPLVWKYKETDRMCDGPLEQIHVDKQTTGGLMETSVLLTSSINCTLSLLEVGRVGQPFEYAIECMAEPMWPLNIETRTESWNTPEHIWRPIGSSVFTPSVVSSMKVFGKHVFQIGQDVSTSRQALMTTLGSETSRGSVYLLNLTEPLDCTSNLNMRRRMREVASFSCTIWTADCNSNGSQAVIGTNLGAIAVNLETGTSSWVCRSKSDLLSLQLDYSGNVVLCGLRNGAIMTIDIRQKQDGLPRRLNKHRIPYPRPHDPSSSSGHNVTKQWFEFRGNVDTSSTHFMTSSISCIKYLHFYDQYFLASSMDGSIKLYDHRMMQRGAVQSYEGHVNSHSRIQLGIDPSERFVLSGGEDCKVRIWCIKSGELLFEDKFSDSVPLTVCWPRTEGTSKYPSTHCGAWLGSQEGLFHMHGL